MISKIRLTLTLAVGAAGLSIYALYLYNTRKRDKESYWAEHRMVLNKSYATIIVENINQISESSNCMITFENVFADDAPCFSILIKGTPDCVQQAEFLVNRLIESSPVRTTATIEIPKEKIQVFVGNFGNTLLNIGQQTGSKLFLKCDPDYYQVSPFHIEIQGSKENTYHAYNLIKEAMDKEVVVSHPPKWDDLPKETPQALLNATQTAQYIEVTISSINSIDQFWIQIFRLGPCLEKMEARISEYFTNCDSYFFKVYQPKVGLMIAVPYTNQEKWHRAKVVSVEKDDNKSNSAIVKALFVDYGDSEIVNVDEIRLLPEEFLQYPYFAIECTLFGVSPKTCNSEGKGYWTDEALDLFESLTSNDPNKILMAKKLDERKFYVKGRVEKKVLPSVHLVDTVAAEEVDVAEELVSKGYGQWAHENSTIGRKIT